MISRIVVAYGTYFRHSTIKTPFSLGGGKHISSFHTNRRNVLIGFRDCSYMQHKAN